MTESKLVAAEACAWWSRLTAKVHNRNYGGERSILYLDFVDYTEIYVFEGH